MPAHDRLCSLIERPLSCTHLAYTIRFRAEVDPHQVGQVVVGAVDVRIFDTSRRRI